MSLIVAKSLSKHFKVLNHREGLIGAMKDLFSTDFRILKAVDNISFYTIAHLRTIISAFVSLILDTIALIYY